jgi:hypothetical protein
VSEQGGRERGRREREREKGGREGGREGEREKGGRRDRILQRSPHSMGPAERPLKARRSITSFSCGETACHSSATFLPAPTPPPPACNQSARPFLRNARHGTTRSCPPTPPPPCPRRRTRLAEGNVGVLLLHQLPRLRPAPPPPPSQPQRPATSRTIPNSPTEPTLPASKPMRAGPTGPPTRPRRMPLAMPTCVCARTRVRVRQNGRACVGVLRGAG